MKEKTKRNILIGVRSVIIFAVSYFVAELFSKTVINTSSFFIVMMTFLVIFTFINSLWRLVQYIIKRVKGEEVMIDKKIDKKQQLHDLLFVTLFAVLGGVVYLIGLGGI